MQYKAKKSSFNEIIRFSPFPCSLLLELFPFGIILNPEMNIMGIGEKLVEIWKGEDVLNKPVSRFFKLRRPKGIIFSWKNVTKIYNKNKNLLKIVDAKFRICNVRIRVQPRL